MLNRSQSAIINQKRLSFGKTIMISENIEFILESTLVMKSTYLKTLRSQLVNKEVITNQPS